MGNKALYDATVPSDGSLALAHENILRVKRLGVFENITGDINNFVDTPTAVTVPREVYGNKGLPSENKIGESWVLSFDVELVRDPVSGELVAAQAWVAWLLEVASKKGKDNKITADWFDALAGALPAYEGSFSVSVAPGDRGYAGKGIRTFTLTSDGVVPTKVSPIAGSGEPVLESALPSGAAAGELVYVRGVFLGDVTAATIGGTAAAEIHNVPGDNYLTILELPAGSAGSAPIILTTAAGASEALPYVRA
ncbi:MAG: hypothetical protein WBA28_02810 [Microbacteriaceae bacterium]